VDVENLYFSQHVLNKLWDKHDLSQEEVEDALYENNIDARWERHKLHGLRAVVHTQLVDGRMLKVLLKPIDPDNGTWSVITAYIEGGDEDE
jgi:hypothetical protein